MPVLVDEQKTFDRDFGFLRFSGPEKPGLKL
jgi:hypothetical protein